MKLESIWLKPQAPQYREETGELGYNYKSPGSQVSQWLAQFRLPSRNTVCLKALCLGDEVK